MRPPTGVLKHARTRLAERIRRVRPDAQLDAMTMDMRAAQREHHRTLLIRWLSTQPNGTGTITDAARSLPIARAAVNTLMRELLADSTVRQLVKKGHRSGCRYQLTTYPAVSSDQAKEGTCSEQN